MKRTPYGSRTYHVARALRRTGVQEVIVGVYAPVDQGGEPIGKQRLHPGGIFYTAGSGIWQTAWLEPVPAAHIDSLVITPRPAIDTVQVRISTKGAAGDRVQAVAYRGLRPVGRARGAVGPTLLVPVPKPRLWSPKDPFLYGLSVRLLHAGHRVDAVGSYFGMRSIAVVSVGGVPKVELNGKPIFMSGALDQG